MIAVVDSGVEASIATWPAPSTRATTSWTATATRPTATATARASRGFRRARQQRVGAAGVCWSCRILPLRVFGPEGFALQTTMADAIDYAVDHGAAVVNVSLYGGNHNPRLEDAIVARGVPAWSSSRPRETKAHGERLSGAFPGALRRGDPRGWRPRRLLEPRRLGEVRLSTCLQTTQIGGRFGAGCGTSGATPLVAGIVALLRARAPSSTVSEIESALARTARRVAGIRFGLVEAYTAMQALGQPAPRSRRRSKARPALGRSRPGEHGRLVRVRDSRRRTSGQRCRGDKLRHCRRQDGRTASSPADRGASLRASVSAPGVETVAVNRTDDSRAATRPVRQPSVHRGRARVGRAPRAVPGSWSGTTLWVAALAGPSRRVRRRGVVEVDSRLAMERFRAGDQNRRRQVAATTTNTCPGFVTAASRPTARVGGQFHRRRLPARVAASASRVDEFRAAD